MKVPTVLNQFILNNHLTDSSFFFYLFEELICDSSLKFDLVLH